MARLARLAIGGQLHSLLHRAKPGAAAFVVAEDWIDYRAALLTTSREAQVAIHAYVLLPDRVQLLLTPTRAEGLSEMMQRLGRRHAGAFNARHGRSGSVWHGRYRVTVLEAAPYLLAATQTIEVAPVAARLVDTPGQWHASSAAHHLGLTIDPLVTEHPLYWATGNTPFDREAAHKALLDAASPESLATGRAIEAATLKAWVLGSSSFVESLQTGDRARRLQPLRGGRPVKIGTPMPASNLTPVN